MANACEVYLLTFASGRQYVGLSTINAKHRYKRHASEAATGKDILVYRAWRKHGAPSLQVLAVVERHEVAATEARAITAYRTLHPHGYNMTPGGEVSPATEAIVRAKIGKASKARGIPRSTIEAARIANTGRKQSAEHAAKSAAARTGRIVSKETGRKISEAKKGRCTVSREHLAKMTAAAAAKPQTQEQIVKRMASIMVNRETWCANISAANMIAWRKRKAERVRGQLDLFGGT